MATLGAFGMLYLGKLTPWEAIAVIGVALSTNVTDTIMRRMLLARLQGTNEAPKNH